MRSLPAIYDPVIQHSNEKSTISSVFPIINIIFQKNIEDFRLPRFIIWGTKRMLSTNLLPVAYHRPYIKIGRA